MKMLNNTKKTRFKMAMYAAIFLAIVIMYAIYSTMESVATTGIGGFLTIVTGYIIGDSYRKSEDKENTDI